MNQPWKDAWWFAYMPMQMHPVSDYRCISGITNLTFLIALYPLAAAPAQCALMGLAAAAEGAGSCQQLLTVIAAWSWVPALSPNLAAGTWGPGGAFLWALCLSPKGADSDFCQGLKIHPMIHGNNSFFLKRRLGRVFWSLAGCKLLLGSILKSIKAALTVSWHSPRRLWQWWTDTDCSPLARGEGPWGLISQHRLQQPERGAQNRSQALSRCIVFSSLGWTFSRPPCPRNTMDESRL